jgi:16S rRNA (cytidine1402-2'-O)-methyltransferase
VNDTKLIFGTMPIGNLDDSTYNLIDHIKNVDLIVVENDEGIKDIINHYKLSISGKIISISPKEFIQNGINNDTTGLVNSREKIHKEILEYISLNKTVLCLSDEGSAIVVDPFDAIRQIAISDKIKYKILPGPSAIIDSISYSKLYDGASFSFYGMIFYNKNKNSIYKIIKDSEYPSVLFYHHEIQKIFFKELLNNLGADKEVTILSNLTTNDEFIMDGTLSDIMNFVLTHKVSRATIVISGKKNHVI